MSFFSRSPKGSEEGDINDSIVEDAMRDVENSIRANAENSQQENIIDIVDSPIDDLYQEEPQRKKKPVALILIVAALATAGLVVVSGLVPIPSAAIQAETAPAEPANPQSLPPALAAQEQAAAVTTGQPGQTPVETGVGAAVDPSQRVNTPAAENTEAAMQAAPQPVQVNQPVAQQSTTPTAPIAQAVQATPPAVPVTQSPAATAVQKPQVQTIAAQKVDAAPAQPVSQLPSQPLVKESTSAVSQPKVSETATPAPQAKPIAIAPAVKTIEPAKPKAVAPKEAPVTTIKAQPVKPVQAQAKTIPHEEQSEQSESVKKMIITTPSRYGLRSVQPEGLIFEAKGTNEKPLVALIGDVLPSGERLLKVDAKTNTIITDRSVIRFQ